MYEGKRQSDDDASNVAVLFLCGDVENYVDEDKSQDDFDEDCADHANAGTAKGFEAVFAEMFGAKLGAAKDCIKQARASESACDLGDYVADEIFETEFAINEHGERNGWVDMAARNLANRVRADDDRKTEGE